MANRNLLKILNRPTGIFEPILTNLASIFYKQLDLYYITVNDSWVSLQRLRLWREDDTKCSVTDGMVRVMVEGSDVLVFLPDNQVIRRMDLAEPTMDINKLAKIIIDLLPAVLWPIDESMGVHLDAHGEFIGLGMNLDRQYQSVYFN